MAAIMQRIAAKAQSMGISLDSFTPDQYTSREYVQKKCDSYNASKGELEEADNFYHCEICKDKKMIAFPKEIKDPVTGESRWDETYKHCKCNDVRNGIRRLKKSGLSDVIENYSFDTYRPEKPWQQQAKASAMRFVQQEGAWFFIGGSVGSGKTHLCTAIAGNRLFDHKKSVLYMMWRDDVAEIKAAMNTERYEMLLNKYKNAPVLYIDDFFKIGQKRTEDGVANAPSSADINIAYEIINHRYISKLETIISSEWYMQELLDFDEATASRIAERAGGAHGYIFNIRRDKANNYRLRDFGMMG